MIDSHVHTIHSHGKSSVDEIIKYVIKHRLNGVGFAEHFVYDYFDPQNLPTIQGKKIKGTSLENFTLYYKKVNSARAKHKNLIITQGVEVDFIQNKNKEIFSYLKNFSFDYIMGSVHFIGGKLKYFSDYSINKNLWMQREYISMIKKSIQSGLFDIIAHPELFKFYTDAIIPEYNEEIKTITDLLKQHNVALEINTDYAKNLTMNKFDLERINPGLKMIKLCYQKGIPLVLGSDAHQADKIEKYFSETKKVLKSLGIKELYYFKNRKKIKYRV